MFFQTKLEKLTAKDSKHGKKLMSTQVGEVNHISNKNQRLTPPKPFRPITVTQRKKRSAPIRTLPAYRIRVNLLYKRNMSFSTKNDCGIL